LEARSGIAASERVWRVARLRFSILDDSDISIL
jgi:hypothetical protein